MVTMPKSEFESYIKSFKFKEIFNYFGWDSDRTQYPPVEIDNDIYVLKSVAQ